MSQDLAKGTIFFFLSKGHIKPLSADIKPSPSFLGENHTREMTTRPLFRQQQDRPFRNRCRPVPGARAQRCSAAAQNMPKSFQQGNEATRRLLRR